MIEAEKDVTGNIRVKKAKPVYAIQSRTPKRHPQGLEL